LVAPDERYWQCCELTAGISSQRAEAIAGQNIREAIQFHVDGMRDDGMPAPSPSTRVEYVEVVA